MISRDVMNFSQGVYEANILIVELINELEKEIENDFKEANKYGKE